MNFFVHLLTILRFLPLRFITFDRAFHYVQKRERKIAQKLLFFPLFILFYFYVMIYGNWPLTYTSLSTLPEHTEKIFFFFFLLIVLIWLFCSTKATSLDLSRLRLSDMLKMQKTGKYIHPVCLPLCEQSLMYLWP